MPTLPEPSVRPIGYQVSWLPEDHPDFLAFRIKIKWREGYKFVVRWRGSCLDSDGYWEPEHITDSLDDEELKEWESSHYFEFKDALTLVKKFGPKLKVNDVTVKDVLEGKEVQPTLFDEEQRS